MVRHINLGKASRPIRYTVNAIIEFEEITGVDLMVGQNAIELLKIKNTRALAFVGLKHGYREENDKKEIPFTIEDVGDWIGFNDGSIEEVMKAFRADNKTDEGEDSKEGEEVKN